VVEELLQRAEDMMRLAQQADVAREHTSFLMEVEAELAAFRRRMTDPAVDLGPIHQRLKSLSAQLRELKFTRREPPPPKPPPPVQAPGEPTWYEVLQVAEGANENEIRASYHKLLKQYHPDLHNHSDFPWVREQAERMTKKLGAAFQILGNPDKRQEYDRTLRRRRN
jgi:DnaJ-domain-containing protein 1